MIVFVGDLHNASERQVLHVIRGLTDEEPAALIQVGDLEWWPGRMLPPRYPYPMYFIDGNHDHLPSLLKYKEPTEVAPNLTYCPRGSTLEIDGRTLGFLGGARSVDRAFRRKGETWFEEEVLKAVEAEPLRGKQIDLLVTHTPPIAVVQHMLARAGRMMTDADYSAVVVQALWEELGRPQLVCGHMHERFEANGVLVLGDMDVEAL